MEAIAHSPSFAKKVHIPQSVGKDYAAADKGKTFKRGGDMKEAMVGKEVAFMKKKGAPKSMIKHEMSEMKGMKAGGRVRRMAAGGTGDPFELSDEDRANYEKNGAENLKRVKGFFGFGDKEEKEVPVPRPSLSPSLLRFNKEEPSASTSRVSNQSPRTRRDSENTSYSDAIERDDAAAMDKTAKGPQYTSNVNQGETDFGYESQRGTKTGSGASGFPSGYKDSGFSALTPAKKRKPVGIEKTEKKERVITEPVDTSYSSLEARRASKKPEETKPESKSGRKFGMASDETRASVRKGLGSFLDFFDLSKAHEREFGKKAAKGGSVKRMRYGGSPEDGMDMGQPMRGGPMPAMAKTPPKPMMPPKQVVKTPPAQMVKKMAEGEMAPRSNGPVLTPNPKSASALNKQQQFNEMMPNLTKIARGIKAGGQVKKMAQGGFTREADGVAKKGKTQGKVVKMAKGGFVKNADGCAQRGKTKAFQVKMKNGGMC
jgi:hypothetical protein